MTSLKDYPETRRLKSATPTRSDESELLLEVLN